VLLQNVRSNWLHFWKDFTRCLLSFCLPRNFSLYLRIFCPCIVFILQMGLTSLSRAGMKIQLLWLIIFIFSSFLNYADHCFSDKLKTGVHVVIGLHFKIWVSVFGNKTRILNLIALTLMLQALRGQMFI